MNKQSKRKYTEEFKREAVNLIEEQGRTVAVGKVDAAVWREERGQLDKLRQARVLQRRFRQHPEPYLAALEERLVKLSLPP